MRPDAMAAHAPSMRLGCACSLPLLIIAATVWVEQVYTRPAAPPPLDAQGITAHSQQERLQQAQGNTRLINRSCPLLPEPAASALAPAAAGASEPAARSGTDRTRLVIFAGFAESITAALNAVLHRLPGSCRPSRSSPHFWSSLLQKTSPQYYAPKTDRAAASAAPRLPPTDATRQRYFHEIVKSQHLDGRVRCSLAFELSERYTSSRIGSLCSCLPSLLRHYLPEVRIVMVIGDPVQRAHLQQTEWRLEACRGRHSGRQLAGSSKSASCTAPGAQKQLAAELRCLRQCGLLPHAAISELLTCSAHCAKEVAAKLKCKSKSCPPLTLPDSMYALFLPLWTAAVPCERLLILQRSTLFKKKETDQVTRLSSLLRFLGVPSNASELDALQRLRPPADPASGLRSNPIDAGLKADLQEFFAPFQTSAQELLIAHTRCVTERFASAAAKRFPTKTAKFRSVSVPSRTATSPAPAKRLLRVL